MNAQIQFVGTTPADLIKQIKEEIIPQLKAELSKEFMPKEPPKYITRAELCEMFQIDLSTENRWRKAGKINAYGIGNRVYYLRSEIDQLLQNSKI